MREINLFFKRIIDIVLGITIFIVLIPMLIIISILIKGTSKGPVLFKQKRIGESGKTFNIYKFRTMIVNAENIGDGLSVKNNDDIRITKIGKFLRNLSLDELPQLINVILGNMSLVGPRPPVIYYPFKGYVNYPEWMKKRFTMKPGITGLSQITVRNTVTWHERIKVDIDYVEKFNVMLDLKILILTLINIFNTKNQYGDTFSVDSKARE